MLPRWMTLYPAWYVNEMEQLKLHYPNFRIDNQELDRGALTLYGELVIRPPGGAIKNPVQLHYPDATPFEHPKVTPLESLPEFDEEGSIISKPRIKYFDRRHQMHIGSLCLLQREPRDHPGGDILSAIDILRRAKNWFIGFHTGKWPPDTIDSELESHFEYGSDILVDQEFYNRDLHGNGRFVFIPDMSRIVLGKHKTEFPYILLGLTHESGGIIKGIVEARPILSRLYPWIKDQEWDCLKALMTREPQLAELGIYLGHWWELPNEPQPFHNGGGLLRTLQPVAVNRDSWRLLEDSLGGIIGTQDWYYIGLKYISRTGDVEWLFLVVPGDNRKYHVASDPQDRKRYFENSKVFIIHAHKLESATLKFRNSKVVDDVVSEKTVALLGLGSLGSEVAELLGKAGIGKIRLCDNDRLALGNTVRHIGGISEFGARKTDVVKSRLIQINPYLEFIEEDIWSNLANSSMSRLDKFMSGTDLIICTIADDSIEAFVNQVAVLLDKPVLYARAIQNASMGRLFLVRPRHDACKSCLSLYFKGGRDGDEVMEDWIDIPENPHEVLLHECGRPVIAGSAIDLSFISGLTARVAVDFLEGREINKNHWIWTKNSASDIDPRLSIPMSVFEGTLKPHPHCINCQHPEIRKIELTEETLSELVNTANASLDAETGGILIGYMPKGQRLARIIRVTGPGDNAERTKTLLRRDPDFVQKELDSAHAELGEKALYIGEWHTHLDSPPQLSATDIDSLWGISHAPNYSTRCPVLIIIGVDTSQKKAMEANSWAFQAGGSIHPIDNNITLSTSGD